MISVEGTMLIHRPSLDVWSFMAEVSNAPKWDTGILEAVQTSSGPAGVGMTVRAMSTLGGRGEVLDLVVTEYEPGRTLGWRFDVKAGRVQVHYGFESQTDGTRLTKRTDVWPKGYFRLLQPLIRRRLQKTETVADLGNVRRLLESKQT